METTIHSIPRPLVKTNQWVIVGSVVLTWITGQVWILAIPLIAGLIGLIFGTNPIMSLAKLFLKKHPTEYIPEDRDQQQFNQTIAVVCLAIGLISFLLGWTIVGYIFTVMVGLAAFIAILGFCIGCFIHFQLNQYKYRRSLK
ncbi:DUF4395 domain-containing protein [Cytobacillus purgationiresistens]|uniref:DUF4395 domain-containing protein n=1 Tax=Cytobacillus purgationiresistens TaxID=863449 RepID=A0ABU0AHH4_9BACI|nr:DUF4395 domain-containing protein [Cytobacillus purgationiresistens]MDQ0270510.1 hypothetical protein [Cytobacillus purgationiresistens]